MHERHGAVQLAHAALLTDAHVLLACTKAPVGPRTHVREHIEMRTLDSVGRVGELSYMYFARFHSVNYLHLHLQYVYGQEPDQAGTDVTAGRRGMTSLES